MPLEQISLDDKYIQKSGRVLLNGMQALVRLPMLQHELDAIAGLNTAGFVTGYRGSPLGAIDTAFWNAEKFLQHHDIRFQPAVNEDLAATAVWGSQQVGLFPGARHKGVFAMWYGKGPGVDRSGDALRHANLAGTSEHGGVLALAGDDHICKSSTTAHQTEFAFVDAMIPVLSPSNIQEIIDYGLYGWAISRYSGCWIALKVVSETGDSTASVIIDPSRLQFKKPPNFEFPDTGLNLRAIDDPLAQEYRLHKYKIRAALAFSKSNRIDKTIISGQKRRFGIVTSGKSYLDVRQALKELGISDRQAEEIGLTVYKVGMTWPLEQDGIRNFSKGLEEILVVEEKRSLIENQIKEHLYNWPTKKHPRVLGKFDGEGNWILPSTGELSLGQIARAIGGRIRRFHKNETIEQKLAFLSDKEKSIEVVEPNLKRIPYFCSGCPHNTSTRVPTDSRAIAGIGCHYMALWMDRNTSTFTHMGGEGATWIGQAPFTNEEHVFTNLGDGTYFHSGIMAIRAAVSAGVNITYKILFNDAVAMTGGQPMDGPLSPQIITRQVEAEGVKRIFVVTDEPEKYASRSEFSSGTIIMHRDSLDKVQRELRNVKGVTVIVYDQTCAAEKRRRRKRGNYPDPAKRIFINELVCEGCGDCSEKSNCLSVVPVDTDMGRKRRIEQSSCNKDYTCLNGFCPSFVTVLDGELLKPVSNFSSSHRIGDWAPVPTPDLPSADTPYGILVTGVGGTGVVTIGALLAMAAHLEGKGCSVFDMTGLAQKGGAVLSHIKIFDDPDETHAVRIEPGGARLVLGCDLIVTADEGTISKFDSGVTRAVVNRHQTITSDFILDPDTKFPVEYLENIIDEATGAGNCNFIEATNLATALLGDSITVNMFMVGYAWQKGLIPVTLAALERAIELNGVAVDTNKKAILWGRRMAHDKTTVTKVVSARIPEVTRNSGNLTIKDLVKHREQFLKAYQNSNYAGRYGEIVSKVKEAEAKIVEEGRNELTYAVARSYFKLLAYKDEYEVARLFTNGEFSKQLAGTFQGKFRIKLHMAPPIFSRRDPDTGELQKREFGSWILVVFRLLAKLKFLRGTVLDIFGYSDERRIERRLIHEYEVIIEAILKNLSLSNYSIAVELASLPEKIRGFGHVKLKNIEAAKRREEKLLKEFNIPASRSYAAE